MYEAYLNKQVLIIDFNGEENPGRLSAIFKDEAGKIIGILVVQDKIPEKKNEIVIPTPFKLKCEVNKE